MDKYKLTADRIFNVDETGVSVNPKGMSKIIATKGKRQVGALSSGERGETVTVEICFSASGAYMPPMFIFGRKKMQQAFMDGIVPGGWVELNESGWMDKDLFFRWFKKFVNYAKPSKERPILLLLDGHSSHTKNLEVINYAREHGVILLCYPPHCTHRLQALDVALMKPISTYYDEEVRKWLRANPGRVVTLQQITKLFCLAYLRAAAPLTAIHGFTKTGVWPVNKDVFTDADFLPSETTDIENKENPAPINNNEEATPEAEKPEQKLPEPELARERTPEPKLPFDISKPGTSKDTSFTFVTPEGIIPIPKIKETAKRISRKRGKTAILTSSPYKNELEESEQIKKQKLKGKVLVKKKLSNESQKRKNNKKVSTSAKKNDSSDSETSDAECFYCGDFYSSSTEGWIACSVCYRWAHILCAGMEDEDDEAILICEHCK